MGLLDKLDLTQRAIAEALGVSRIAVSKWLSGDNNMQAKHIMRAAEVFSLDPVELAQTYGSADTVQLVTEVHQRTLAKAKAAIAEL